MLMIQLTVVCLDRAIWWTKNGGRAEKTASAVCFESTRNAHWQLTRLSRALPGAFILSALSFSLSLFLSLPWQVADGYGFGCRRYGNLLLARVYTLKKQAVLYARTHTRCSSGGGFDEVETHVESGPKAKPPLQVQLLRGGGGGKR